MHGQDMARDINVCESNWNSPPLIQTCMDEGHNSCLLGLCVYVQCMCVCALVFMKV